MLRLNPQGDNTKSRAFGGDQFMREPVPLGKGLREMLALLSFHHVRTQKAAFTRKKPHQILNPLVPCSATSQSLKLSHHRNPQKGIMRSPVLLPQKSNLTSLWKTTKSIYFKIMDNSKFAQNLGVKNQHTLSPIFHL